MVATVARIIPASSRILNLFPDDRKVPIVFSPSVGWKLRAAFFDRFFIAIAGHSRRKVPIFKTVTYSWRGRPLRMRLNVTEATQCSYYFSYPYLPLVPFLIQGSSGSVFLDIGANVGIFSLLAGQTFGRVYAFEPNLETFARLRDNRALNSLDTVEALPLALSESPGEMILHENPTNVGGSSLNAFQAEYKAKFPELIWRTQAVPVTTLDLLVSEKNITRVDLIKIDVEGHEEQVLRGATETLRRFQPLLFVEITTKKQFAEVCAALPGGYRAFDPYRRAPLSDKGAWTLSDVIFATRDPWTEPSRDPVAEGARR